MSNDRIFEANVAWRVNAIFTLQAAKEANRRSMIANRAHRSPETKTAYTATKAAVKVAVSNIKRVRQNYYRLLVEASDGV